MLKPDLGFGDDFGNELPPPDGPGGTIQLPFVPEDPTWSAGTQLTFSSSTDVTTTVAMYIENGFELANDPAGPWQMIARTNQPGWRTSGYYPIDPLAMPQNISITLGDNEVPNYGQQESFYMYVDLISPSNQTFTYAVQAGAQLILENLYDSSGPVHGATTPASQLVFSFGPTDTSVQSKSVYFDVTDPESGVLIISSPQLSTTSYGASISHTTTINITNGRRFIYSLSFNGANIIPGTDASVGVRITATNGAMVSTTSSWLYAAVQKLSDSTGPTLSVDATDAINLSASAGTLNNSTYRAINFSASDSSGIASVSVTGNNTTSENVKYYGISNLGGGNYRQTIYVSADKCSIGGSASFSYTITATDTAGNSTVKQHTVNMTRTDNVAPTFSTVTDPANLTLYTSNGTNQSAYRDFRFAVSDAHTSIDQGSVQVHKVSGNGTSSTYYQAWSGNEFSFRVYVNSDNYTIGAPSIRDAYYITVRDVHGNLGTSPTLDFYTNLVDNNGPSISVQRVDSKTFYTSNNTGNPTGQTSTGYIYWSASDNVGVTSASGSRIGSTSYISSVGSTVGTSSYGAQYRTSYVLISNFSYGSGYTARSLVRLTASDAAGNIRSFDTTISGRLIDNSLPYFNNIPSQEDKTWYTSGGANQSFTFSKSIDVADQHQSVVSHSVTKVAGTFSESGITSSLSGGKVTFAFTPNSNAQTANSSFTLQAVRISITDSAGNVQSVDYNARTRFIDNTTPNILPTSGSTNEENCNFFTSNPQNVSRTVYFTVSDSFSAINTNTFTISTPGIYYMSVSGISNHSGNTYKYTCTIPVSGKGIVPTRTFWGYVDVGVSDIYGNTGAMRTNFYGTHVDNVAPSISNVSAPAYNFTTAAGQTSISNTLTFRVLDSHSGLNTPTVSGSNGATAGTITAGSSGYYTCPVTVSRPGLTSSINAKVTINASDVHGNSANTVTYTLPGSYVDNKGPVIASASGNSSVNFAVSSATSIIDRAISLGVTDEIALSSVTVTPLNGALGEIRNLSGISGTSSTVSFDVRHVRFEYSAESSQTESYRVTCSDSAGNYSYRDFSISVNYNDDTSPSISNAATTASVDFTESNGQGEKTVTYTFNASDTGSGVASVVAVSDLDITQPVKGSGTAYSMNITVDRGSFPHDDNYHTVGSFTITVTDNGGNTSNHSVTVRAKLTDNVAPLIETVTASNVNMTTTGGNATQTFAIGVADSGAINASSLQAQKTAGNGSISANFSSGKINVTITNAPGSYTANNVYVNESYRVRIADDNGNYSGWRTIAFQARVRDTSAPTITSLVVPSYTFTESGVEELTRTGVIRLTDAHMGINPGSFSASLNPANRGVNVGSMTISPGVGANEYVYNLTVNKTGQVANGSPLYLTLNMSIQDYATNSASTNVSIPVTVNDDIAPSISFLGVPSATALSSQNRIKSYTVTYTVNDSTDGNPPAGNVTLSTLSAGTGVTVTNIAATQKTGSTYTNAVTVNASGLPHDGTANVRFRVTAEDAAGNTTTADSGNSVITVVDDVNPTVSVSSAAGNITLNNTNNTSQSVSATFLVNDDLTAAGSLNVNAHGASKTHSNGTVTLTKTFTYASGTSGSQELRCTVTDAAGNTATAASTFVVNRQTFDLTAPTISAPTATTNGGTNKVILNANTTSYLFTIASTITDSGTGIDESTVKISSNNGSISGQVLHDTFDPVTGAATFRVTWTLNDSRWASLWSNSSNNTIFSETFTIHASDREGAPYTNSATNTIVISLIRQDLVAPSLSISNIQTGGANISGSNPLLYSDANRTSNEEMVINIVASDSQTNLDQETWQLVLAPVPASGNSLTYATSNGSYNFGTPGSTGLDVVNTSGNNYQIAFRLQQPSSHSILGDIATGGIPFGKSTLRATLSVSDNNNNTSTTFVDFVIKRLDEALPVVGNLIARTGSLTAVTVSHSATSATHKIKVAASDAGSGLQSVTMNNSYVPDSPASALESGTRYYYFKRVYTFLEVWQNQHQSQITVSGLKATAADTQGNSKSSNSVNVVITANDTENPSITAKSLGSSVLNLNTSGTTSAIQTFSVTINDDDRRAAGVSVAVVEVEGTGSFTLTNTSGASQQRVFTGQYTYQTPNFSIGSHNRNWNIIVTDAAGNSVTDAFPEFTVNVADTTSPSITSVTIFNSSGQSVSSATLDTATNTNFSGYIDIVMSDAHSSVDVAGLKVTSTAPVIISPVQVLTATKGRVTIAVGASAHADALGYGSRNLQFNILGKDVYGNATNTNKVLALTINDSTPPAIANMSVSNISLNHDVDGVNDPAAQAFVLTANVSDAGSGLNAVSASVTFNSGIASATNAPMSFIGKSGSLYEWRYTVSPDDLSVNASPTTYTFKITAAPNYGSNSIETTTATAELRDDTGPRLTMSPVERLSGVALSANELVDILTSVGSVTLVYEVTAVEKSDPITLANITSAAGDLNYTIQSSTAKSVKASVVYTAAQVLALTGNAYNQDVDHNITMVLNDSHGNQSSVESAVYRLRVYDNQNPTVDNFAASDDTIVLKTSAKTQTITFSAVIADNVQISTYSLPGATYTGKSGNTYNWTKTFNYADYVYGVNPNETYTLTVTDSNGNTTIVNETVSIVKIDDENPTITSFSANTTSVTLLTNAQSQTVTLTAEMSDNVAITSYALPTATFVGKSGNTYTWTKTYNYDDVAYGPSEDVLTVSASDAEGNPSTADLTINITKTDNENPSISSFTASANAVTLLTSNKTQTVDFTAVVSDNVAVVSVVLDGGATPVTTTGSTRTWTNIFNYASYSYGNTPVTFTLTVTDSTGNVTTDTVNILVTKSDDQHPSVQNVAFNNDIVILTSSNRNTARTLTATISDNVAIDTVTLSDPTAAFQGSSNGVYTWAVYFKYADFNYGGPVEYTYTVTATDTSGNEKTGSAIANVTKLDNADPVVANFVAAQDVVNLTTSAQSVEIDITATISDNVGIKSVTLPGANLISDTNGSYLWRKTYNYADYANYGSSTDTLTLTVTDTSDNVTIVTETVNVIKSDDQNPVINSFSVDQPAITLKSSVQSRTVTITAAVSDNVAIQNAVLSSNTSVQPTLLSSSGGNYTWTKTYSYADYGYGANVATDTFTLTVTDTAGNEIDDTASVTISKEDDANPVINSFTVSSNAVTLLTSSQLASVTFNADVADNVAIQSVTLDGNAIADDTTGNTRSWAKGFSYGDFNFGPTPVTFTLTVTDTSDNTATESIVVVVTKSDDEGPAIESFTADTTTPTVSSVSPSQTVTFTAVINDNRAVTSVDLSSATLLSQTGKTYTFTKVYNYADFTNYGANEDNLTLTAEDAAGNSSTADIQITLTKADSDDPTIANFVADTDNITVKTSDKTKTVTFTATISDNVGIGSVDLPGATLQEKNGSSYTWTKVYNYDTVANYGLNTDTMVLTVSDVGGNTVTAEEVITITKIDDEVPTIASFTASNTNVLVKSSVQTQTVTFTATITDNVAIQSATLDGAQFQGSSGNVYTWTKVYNYADYSYGVNDADVLVLTVVDSSSNESTDDVSVVVTKLDDLDPSIDSFSVDHTSVSLLTSAKTKLVTFNATVSDNVQVSSVELTGPGIITEVVSTGNTRSWTKLYDYVDYNYADPVTETFTLTVKDSSGLTQTGTVDVLVTKADDESPIISSFTVNSNTVTLLTSAQVQTLYYTAIISDNVLVTEVSTPGGSAATITNGNQYSWSKDFNYADYTYGSHLETHTVVAGDAAGNTASASTDITVSKVDNQVPASTSISVDKTDFALTQTESTTITITAGFRDLQTGMSAAVGSAKVLLENGTELEAGRIDSLTITTSNGGSDSTVVAVINVSFDDLEYGDNLLKYKISAEDNSGNAIISDLVTITGNKYDSIPPEILSYKLKIDGVETNSVEFNETTRTTAILTIEAEVKDNKVGTIVKVNNQTTSDITAIDGVANGEKHVWTYNLVNTAYPIEETTNLSYTVAVTDADGLTATSQTLPLNVTRLDNVAPVISINNVEAIELALGSNDSLADIISGNNEFTIKSNPALALHRVKLRISLSVVENNSLAAGYPAIHPVTGWNKSNDGGGNYTFTKIVSGADLSLGLNNLAYNISAVDSAAAANSHSVGVTYIATVLDNTNPVISSFTMSGVPEVSGVPTILLQESAAADTVTANFSLATNDNGAVSSTVVQIRDAANGISFDLTPTSSGSGTYNFSKVFTYADFNLANGVVSNLTMTARVEDAAGNVTISDAIDVELRQVDDVSPAITYNLTAGYTVSADSVVLTDGHLWTYTSSQNAAGQSVAYLRANVSGSDPRGITSINVAATSAQGNAPTITMTDQGSGVFTGSLNYSSLPEYGVAYTYQITATVSDAQGQTTVETKNISFNKLDDVSPTASLALVDGLVGGVLSMSTADIVDNVIYVELDVDENTTLALSNGPVLSLNGPGATVTLVEFTPSGTGPTGRYRYQVVLDKNDYQFTNLEAGFDQGSRIASESVKMEIVDAAGNLLSAEPVELFTFNTELSDVGAPFASSVTFSATNGIQAAGVNSNQFNLSVHNVSDSTKITIAAALGDNETTINPDAVGISGFNAAKSYNVATKTAFFEITVNRAFYDALAQYDQYESKPFTITFKDVAGNVHSVDGALEFRRTDSDVPVINSWTVNGQSSATIIHYDHHTGGDEQTIDVLLAADVSDERLANMYYTTTKNEVLLPGETGSGSWINQSFASVRPPKGSAAWVPPNNSDEYVFTLYAVDANGATVSSTVSLTVQYLDVTNPSINDLTFMSLARQSISELQILTEGESDATAIVRELIIRASLYDHADTLDQLQISLEAADAFSDNVITNIERLANKEQSAIEFKVTITTGTYLTGVLQPVTVRLDVEDRAGNTHSNTEAVNVKIADNQAPVIYNMTTDFYGDETSFQNHVRATYNINDKLVTHQVIAYVTDETEVDLTSAVFQDSNGKSYDVISAISNGTYQASPAFKITAQRIVNYDEVELLLGSNTLTVTATVADVNGNVSDPASVSKNLYKEDALAPTLLAMGLYPDDATSVKDGAWPAALIDVVDDANIDANGVSAARAKSVFVIINADIPSSTADQVLLETSGSSLESSLIMCIKNHRFVVAAGSNSGSELHNTSTIFSFDMRDGANLNPLADHMGSGSPVELALLVRLDVGAIILYVNGRLAAAAQADERNMPAWAGVGSEIALGHLVSDVNKRNAFGPEVTLAASNYDWSEAVHGLEVYEWTSTNSAKVSAEASSVNVSLDVNNTQYRGELRFTCLDNEPDVAASLSKNGASNVETIVNGIVREDVDFDYVSASGTTDSNDTYVAKAVQFQTIGTNKAQSLETTRTMTINYQNLDIEAPVVTGFTIVNETTGNDLDDVPIVELSSSADVTLLITIDKTDNSGVVADTESFALSVNGVDFTQLSSQVAGDSFSFRYVASWDDFFATGDPDNAEGDYFLNVTASVRDAGGNVSLSNTRIVHIRTTDNSVPIISSSVFTSPPGMPVAGSIAGDDYTGTITLSSANPTEEVRVKVNYTDNNIRYGGSFGVNGVGAVYTNGPAPRSQWSVTGITSDGLGGYSTTLVSVYSYNALSYKNNDQYRFGPDGNLEQLTATLTDPHGNAVSFNFRVKVIMLDDVSPSLPQLTLSRPSIILQPGDVDEVITLTVTTHDNSNVVAGDVSITVNTAGQDDISGLISTFTDITPANPQPSNEKVFSAQLTLDYTDITGPNAVDKSYTLGVIAKDSFQNTTTNNSAATLLIQRVDNEPPTIQQVKRNIVSTLYSLSVPASKYTASYNETSVSAIGDAPTDLIFAIADVGGLNASTLFIKRSAYSEASATNPILADPDFSASPEIGLILKENGLYEPTAQLTFQYSDFSEYSVNNTNKVYYQWWMISATDLAGNQTVIYMPWRISKVDEVDPSVTQVSLAHSSVKDGNTLETSDYVVHATAEQLTIDISSAIDKKVFTFKVAVSDNHEVATVCLLGHPNDPVTNVFAGPNVDGFYTFNREYAFNNLDGYGTRFLENLYVVAIDETGNRNNQTAHHIPVYINQIDVTAPTINLTIVSSDGADEIMYPGTGITLVATGSVTDANTGVLTSSVQQVGAANGWTFNGIQPDSTFQWSKQIDWDSSAISSYTESFTIEAEDNAGNRSESTATFDYSITSNNNIGLVGSSVVLHDVVTSAVTSVTANPFPVDPGHQYEAEYVFVMNDPNNLQSPVAGDVTLTGNGTLVSQVKDATTTGNQTFTVRVAFDTSNFVQGDSNANEIKVDLIIRDPYGQQANVELAQKWYVWDYETIELGVDYYYIYEANINPLINTIRDNTGAITGYSMNAITGTFEDLQRVGLHLPSGTVDIPLNPFLVEQRDEDDDSIVKNSWSFTIDSVVSASNQGVVEATLEVEDKSIDVSYIDDYSMAQVIYSNFDQVGVDANGNPLGQPYVPSVVANTPDTLYRNINRDYLLSHPAISASINARSLNFLRSDAPQVATASLDAIPSGGSLDQLAYRNGLFGQENIIETGQFFVLNGTVNYTVVVNDANQVPYTVVDSTPVKLVIKHKPGIATIR